jgi:Stigma-specific protein, Stig1
VRELGSSIGNRGSFAEKVLEPRCDASVCAARRQRLFGAGDQLLLAVCRFTSLEVLMSPKAVISTAVGWLVASLGAFVSIGEAGCTGRTPLIVDEMDAGPEAGPSSDAQPADAHRVVDGDSAEAATCSGGATLCAGLCVDIASSSRNCGSCGNVCGGGTVCSFGVCVATCAPSLTNCNESCIDTQNDNANCGACGLVCDLGQVCFAGACTLTCQRELINCNGRCIDPSTSNAHCGATASCGAGDVGSAGTACDPGQVCSGDVCSLTCQRGLLNCDGSCVDPKVDNQHCGATDACGAGDSGSPGTACGPGKVCSDGVCGLTCQPGLLNCNGKCVDPTTSNQYCGASGACGAGDAGSAGQACPSGEVCSAGTCGLTCQAGFIACAGSCVDPLTNNRYCGARGACGAGGSGSAGATCASGEVCSGGLCAVSCQGGQVDCGGVCVDPMTNPNHCGASNDCAPPHAGTACAQGTQCSAGVCTTQCAAGLTVCGNQCVDATRDVSNCGGCGITCVGCRAGSCSNIVNGSFETSDYTGWTLSTVGGTSTFGTWSIVADRQTVGSLASVFDFLAQTSVVERSPDLPITYAVPDGRFMAVSFQNGPQEHRMSQTILIPPAARTLSWSMQYENTAGAFVADSQFSAIYLRDPQTDAILATIWKTTEGTDPHTLPLTAMTGTIPFAYQGKTVKLDVDHQVQLSFFSAAWDNFVIQ